MVDRMQNRAIGSCAFIAGPRQGVNGQQPLRLEGQQQTQAALPADAAKPHADADQSPAAILQLLADAVQAAPDIVKPDAAKAPADAVKPPKEDQKNPVQPAKGDKQGTTEPAKEESEGTGGWAGSYLFQRKDEHLSQLLDHVSWASPLHSCKGDLLTLNLTAAEAEMVLLGNEGEGDGRKADELVSGVAHRLPCRRCLLFAAECWSGLWTPP
jgi:type IV secretory pathway VirB10-like protein